MFYLNIANKESLEIISAENYNDEVSEPYDYRLC